MFSNLVVEQKYVAPSLQLWHTTTPTHLLLRTWSAIRVLLWVLVSDHGAGVLSKVQPVQVLVRVLYEIRR